VYADSNAKTIGTALLFPPADFSPFSGGDLVFKNEEDDQISIQTIHPDKFKAWTLITFGHLQHKCTPVLSGTRYVLKAQIWSMYPEIMTPAYFTLEDITYSIILKQSQPNKQELLKSARQRIADLYTTYLETMRLQLEKKRRDVLEYPDGKLMHLARESISNLYYKDHSILPDNHSGQTDRGRTKYKEASTLDSHENIQYIQLEILKTNYNNLVLFLDDDNDALLDVENIITNRDFTTKSLGNSPSTDDDSAEQEYEFKPKLKTVLVLSSLYKTPYDLSSFDIKHLKLLRNIENSGIKYSLFNKRYEIFVPVADEWHNDFDYHSSQSQSQIRINIDRANFNWLFEYPKYPGVMQNKESQYNDETGCDNTFIFESTCILIWQEE
jgi:hypothetical protein